MEPFRGKVKPRTDGWLSRYGCFVVASPHPRVMGRLIGLELHNFKSYRGKAAIGFGTAAFTSIIGPNGAGKSNMMDAISFVLGVQSSHLRSSSLRDLIYRGRRGTEADPELAYVKAIYERGEGDVLHLKRVISAQGVSEYSINDRVVTALEYQTILKRENILVKARNFLVFQGDVELIANQSPRDLSVLIETISGLGELAAEYSQLREELEQAHNELTLVFSQKRLLNLESKEYKEQMEEQRAFERLLTERNNLIKMGQLYRLYHNEQKHNEIKRDVDAKNAEVKRLKKEVAALHKSHEKEIAKHAKEAVAVQKITKALAGVAAEVDACNRDLIPKMASGKSTKQKISAFENKSAALEEDITKQEAERADLEAKLGDLQRQYDIFKGQERPVVELPPAAVAEYGHLRSHFLSVGGLKLEEELALLLNDKDLVSAGIANLQQQRDNAQARIDELTKNLRGEFSPRMAELRDELNDLMALRASKTEHREALVRAKEAATLREVELNRSLRDVMARLDELASSQRESQRQKKLRENVHMLKNAFKEDQVLGLVHELVRPTQRRYELALQTALGRHHDSIIVESTAIAHKCIEILKDNRAGTATFIPLDVDADASVNLNFLRNVSDAATPAIDVVEYENLALERAMRFILGDTMVTQSVEVARELKWGSAGLHNKMVVEDGSIIHRLGLMTGGAAETTTTQWNKHDYKRLSAQRDEYLEELTTISETRPREVEIGLLQEEIASVDERVPVVRDQLSSYERRVHDREAEIEFQHELIAQIEATVEGKQHRLGEVGAAIADVEKRIGELQTTVYGDFCVKHGIDGGIAAYEASHVTSSRRVREGAQYVKALASLASQKEFHDERLEEVRVRRAKLHDELRELSAKLEAIDEEVQTGQRQLEGLIEQHQQLQTEKDTLVQSASSKLKQSADFETTISDLEAQIAAAGRSASQLSEKLLKYDTERVNILKNCKIASIDLPLLEGFLDQISLTSTSAEVYDIRIDYGLLTPALREAYLVKMEAELTVKLEAVKSELEQLTPNAKAMDRLKETENKLRVFERDFQRARQKEQRIQDKFSDVKQRRNDAFRLAFDHIAKEIDFIYKELTKSSASPLGGSAYLTLEDEDEPYLSGIKYHAMPPLKRFRDMDLLSGGEKTVAALALLFAIHLYQPSPFFVLDEVDAALDNANVGRVANYIKKHAGPEFQVIVISLRSNFFEKSDSLVGIYREQRENSSRTVTLDLRQYQEA